MPGTFPGTTGKQHVDLSEYSCGSLPLWRSYGHLGCLKKTDARFPSQIKLESLEVGSRNQHFLKTFPGIPVILQMSKFSGSTYCGGTSLLVQWLRLYSQCRGPGFDPWTGN